jgi:hypothetical protein
MVEDAMDGHDVSNGSAASEGGQLLALEAQKLASDAAFDRRNRIRASLTQGWDFLLRCNALPDLDREEDAPTPSPPDA